VAVEYNFAFGCFNFAEYEMFGFLGLQWNFHLLPTSFQE
jgi:hypothetical protein